MDDELRSTSFHIEEVDASRGQVCRDILESLPEWFAIPEAIAEYAEGVAEQPMLVAKQTACGEIIGFLSLRQHTPSAIEAYVLGVRREWHRTGCGSMLFQAAEAHSRALGAAYLTVKTIAESSVDPFYKRTRQFYEAIGFEPMEIFPTLWGAANPCLFMLKRLI